MNAKAFYVAGVVLIIKGFLVLNGVKLPKRNGMIIDEPSSYGIETIVFGIMIMIATFVISKKSRKVDK
jgi:hypothetical protein